ncbi:glycosyltransferase [Jannaschia sp. CCS1]|uniref:glycosyltransferase n=1 Tax=Jannaschia sp. (strain CCS1) TaxID=290400 RepID=UPI000053CFAD|nr:glycosyltransferase [Jannaschia sp. CCS1]ABD53136.1 glycosyl transferase group 1 [Jannaschia sp. CCS1]
MSGLRDIPGLWLDITRLLTRVGRGALTGIDRVEAAYLAEALAGDAKFLCRTTRGYLLLDQTGGRALFDLCNGAVMGRADWISRLTLRGHKPRHRAEAVLRRHAVARCRPAALPKFLQNHAAPGSTYVNVGHSNLSEATLSAVSGQFSNCAVLIHDLIPLTHPAYVADDMPARFAGRMDRVRRYADLVICNSSATQFDLIAHWGDGQTVKPKYIVAHPGVTPRPRSDDLDRDAGHFVMLGTIEARKNHDLMLDVWELLAQDMPRDQMPTLHIIGAVGWKVDALMERLRSHPLYGDKILLNGPYGVLDDHAVQDHLARATALLFPSLAEGYGFPPLEAAMAGAVPICSNLAVFRETLGDCAVYVDNNDAYSWVETIKQHFYGTAVKPELTMLKGPTWAEHFDKVAQAIQPPGRKGRQ